MNPVLQWQKKAVSQSSFNSIFRSENEWILIPASVSDNIEGESSRDTDISQDSTNPGKSEDSSFDHTKVIQSS